AVLPAQTLSRSERKERIRNLPEVYRQFLLDVEPIMQPSEQTAFLTLGSDAQRDVFIEAFWKRHAPEGMSGDAYRKRYYELIEDAAARYRKHTDRYVAFVVNGEPADVYEPNCRDYVVPIQVWHFVKTAAGGERDVIFYIPKHGIDYKLWQPQGRNLSEALQELLTSPLGENQGVQRVFYWHHEGSLLMPPLAAFDCYQSDRLIALVEKAGIIREAKTDVFRPAPVSDESMKLLLKSMVMPDPKAPKFETEMSVRFTRRDGNRTDAEITIPVPRSKLAITDIAGTKSYRVDVTGEVLKDDQLFEKYRYRFDFPADTKLESLPVVIDRLLPRGTYKLRVKVADAESHAEAIVEKEVEVPDSGGQAIMPGPTGRIACPPPCTDTELRIVP